jgi:hypothetical protein
MTWLNKSAGSLTSFHIKKFLPRTSNALQYQYRPSFTDTAHMQVHARALVVTLSAYLSALHRTSQTNKRRERKRRVERERAVLAQKKSEWVDVH